jgi:hypothetical protein
MNQSNKNTALAVWSRAGVFDYNSMSLIQDTEFYVTQFQRSFCGIDGKETRKYVYPILQRLKKEGFIKKSRYGVWRVIKPFNPMNPFLVDYLNTNLSF